MVIKGKMPFILKKCARAKALYSSVEVDEAHFLKKRLRLL
jgi:hypothetical protein